MQTRTGIIALVLITAITYFFLFSGVFTPVPMTESEIRDLVKDRYPNSLGDPTYDEDCIICDATGCHPYGEPCWRVTRVEEDGGKSVETSVDESGEEISSTESPCTEWWCDAEPCSHEYSILVDNVTHDYTNYGCDNPSPTCDQELELCRACSLSDECVMTETYQDNLTTVYVFSVIGTGGYSTINDSGYVCQVFEGEDMLLMNTTTISECRMIAEFYSKCGTPGCNFEPSFGMIPY